MKALVLTFEGSRSAEMLAADDRAGRDRLGPAILAHPRMREEFVSLCVLRQPGGRQKIVITTRSETGLRLLQDIVSSSELLPGEDTALLPGPDSVEIFDVVAAVGRIEPVGMDFR